jgi:RNA polymerase sigma-70 factor, ECF subfamily
MLAVAYRMLGQVADAEDVVQEAWLRWSSEPRDDVRDPGAFLVTMTSRLALDRLRRIAARREAYPGEWLPEPLDTGSDPATGVLVAESVSYGLLVVLETLSPLERVVYVLREAFGHSHAEIAAMLDRSEEAVRQAASRARAHVRGRSSRFRPDHETARLAADRFLDAASGGDLGPFLELLAPDVELVADSGGKVRAPRLPVYGAAKVTRFLEAILQRGAPEALTTAIVLNGSPAVVVRIAGSAVAAMLLDADEGRISRVYLVANPDKLARIGDVTSR